MFNSHIWFTYDVYSQIHVIGKHKPVPPTTYEYPKDHEALDQAKENNRKVSQVWELL